MKRTANAEWHGDLKTGTGALTTASATLSHTPYSFTSRFEQGKGTNPEELLAAAHACTIALEQKDGGWAITESHLDLKAKVPGATKEAFDKATQAAKAGCPVSKLYNTNITLNATLG
jgi:osmotically inducible protein OsmC